MFTDDGQELQHANELLVRLNQWKKICQVDTIKTYKYVQYILYSSNRLNNGRCQPHNELG